MQGTSAQPYFSRNHICNGLPMADEIKKIYDTYSIQKLRPIAVNTQQECFIESSGGSARVDVFDHNISFVESTFSSPHTVYLATPTDMISHGKTCHDNGESIYVDLPSLLPSLMKKKPADFLHRIFVCEDDRNECETSYVVTIPLSPRQAVYNIRNQTRIAKNLLRANNRRSHHAKHRPLNEYAL